MRGGGGSFFAMILPQPEQTTLHEQIDFNRPITDPVNQFARSTRVNAFQCPGDTWDQPVTVWPGSIGIDDLSHNSYVGCPGEADPTGNGPTGSYLARYEELSLNGMFHRNTAIRYRDITDETSNTIGIGERASMFSPSGWAGVIPGGQTVFSQRIATQRGEAVGDTVRPAITMTTVHVRSGGPNAPTGSPGGFRGSHAAGANFLLMDRLTRAISSNVDIRLFQAFAGRNDGVIPDEFFGSFCASICTRPSSTLL